jgi:hypothetical protein
MRRYWLLAGLVLLSAAVAAAQTKLSGAGQCAKPHTTHTVEIPDRPNHVFAMAQTNCTWSKPVVIAGVEARGGKAVQFDEVSGNASTFHGYYIDRMASGDEVHYSYEGRSTMKAGIAETSTWKWKIEGGTGKLKGIQGEGSCKGSGRPDGGSTWECQGEYRTAK